MKTIREIFNLRRDKGRLMRDYFLRLRAFGALRVKAWRLELHKQFSERLW